MELILLKNLKDSLRFNSASTDIILSQLKKSVERQFFMKISHEIKLKNLCNSILLIDEYMFKNHQRLTSPENSEPEYYDTRNWLRDASGTNDSETMNDTLRNLD